MKISKIVLRFFGYFSIEEIEAKIKFAEFQIKTIKDESNYYINLIRKGEAGTAISDDLRHNRGLLPYYQNELKLWTKKLKKIKK